MSHTYSKFTFAYDNCMGEDETTTIYCHTNNTCDYQTYYDSNGDAITLNGPDDYLRKIAEIILGQETDVKIEPISQLEFNKIFQAKT